MIPPLDLVPLPAVLPLAVAAAMLTAAHFLPARVPDAVAMLTALAVAAIAAVLAADSAQSGMLVYWFGGWTPRPGVVLGIGFGVDSASAGIAAFIGLLFAATIVFAWGYFDEVHAHFHVLMLLFLGAMEGFCLTRDLFNLFVWFEVMSVAAFALTAYHLERPSLVGALNFTVTNSLASFMMLAGIGLIYARVGALDFQALSTAVARQGADPVTIGAFCLLAAALMIKAAIVPFHFWLSDAHAVAPSPVCVIFSGAMVAVGLFALAKLAFWVFAGSAEARFLVRDCFMALGGTTAILGALMAWGQRHLKRMLAFSTIAHLGIMLAGVAALSSTGLAGLFVYIVGHGLVKGSLFMLAGVLLATRASIDELELRGLGRGLGPAGIAMTVAGLLLGGAPWGVLDAGMRLIGAAARGGTGVAVEAAIVFAAALTGGAVLRATGRIFLGLGSKPDPAEVEVPTEAEQKEADRPLWLMMTPCVALLVLALLPGHLAAKAGLAAAAGFGHEGLASAAGITAVKLSEAPPIAATLLAIAIAAFDLARDRLPPLLYRSTDRAAGPLFRGLGVLHSGLVGDYVAWICLGLGGFALALAFG
ncbi:MAG TPA: proton-conducting transporter membrane subunit [Stellaceae bacterium]|jgi:multicomponent Na+:H+ antiporter subunit D|nr:proton-conducting transporter membrane subunit [Stellaceae bacterium]